MKGWQSASSCRPVRWPALAKARNYRCPEDSLRLASSPCRGNERLPLSLKVRPLQFRRISCVCAEQSHQSCRAEFRQPCRKLTIILDPSTTVRGGVSAACPITPCEYDSVSG